LRDLPPGTFEASLKFELEHSYGRDYSEMHRLVPLANLPDRLKPLVAAAFKLYEERTLAEKVPGPFCSELVSRVYEHMGLTLFDESRTPSGTSPNHLARSKLDKKDEIVVPSSKVASFEPIGQTGRLDEMLYPESGDRLAPHRRSARLIESRTRKITEMAGDISVQSRGLITEIQTDFTKQMEAAIGLLVGVQATGSELLSSWALRLCERHVEFAPEAAALSDEPVDQGRLTKGYHEILELGSSLFRITSLWNIHVLRREIAMNRSPIRRSRLRMARRKALKKARETLHGHALARAFSDGFQTFPSTGMPQKT
jgi:hypothetical protein